MSDPLFKVYDPEKMAALTVHYDGLSELADHSPEGE